jgi:hypothetical protein
MNNGGTDMTFDRTAWRRDWKSKNTDATKAQIERDNTAKKLKRQNETPEEREARLTKQRAKHKSWREANPERLKDYRNKGRAKNYSSIRRSQRDYILRSTYGLNLDQYEAMLTSQGNCCAICGTDQATTKHANAWRVDHCHSTGKVRALLCHNCNIAMGLLKENTGTLEKMIAYINHHNATTEGNHHDEDQ